MSAFLENPLSALIGNPYFLGIAKAVVLLGCVLFVVAYLTLAERKVSAFIQGRLGPNRTGPWGLLQPVADGVKFIFKEDITVPYADKLLFILAPMMVFVPAFISLAVVPVGGALTLGGQEIRLEVADVNVGVLLIFAMSAMAVYGVFLGGYASNNKYSFLGGLRSSAQMISYELPFGLAAVGVFMAAGSFRLREIVDAQMWGVWYVVPQIIGFLVFIVSAFAETNRLPFDLPEAEQELVGGYHTEYSSMKFGMFFMGEYAHMITASCLTVLFYFGGWHVPFVQIENPLLQLLVFAAKVGFLLFVFLWVRWTLPRFRYDQLMRLGWKTMIPLALLNLLVVGVLITMGWL
jgi:NADH-quinone oxidoreductase subunit H